MNVTKYDISGNFSFSLKYASKMLPEAFRNMFLHAAAQSKCSQTVVQSTLLHFLSVWGPFGLKSEVPTVDVAKCDISGNFNFSSKSVFKMLPKAFRNVFWCAAAQKQMFSGSGAKHSPPFPECLVALRAEI